jgi:hypothetical protein
MNEEQIAELERIAQEKRIAELNQVAALIKELIHLYPLPKNKSIELLECQLRNVLNALTTHGMLEINNTDNLPNFLSGLLLPIDDANRPKPTTVFEHGLELHVMVLNTFKTPEAHDKLFEGLLIESRSFALFVMCLFLAQQLDEDNPYDLRTFRTGYDTVRAFTQDGEVSKSDFLALEVRVLEKIGIIDKSVTGPDEWGKSPATFRYAPPPAPAAPQSIFTLMWNTVMGPATRAAPARESQRVGEWSLFK